MNHQINIDEAIAIAKEYHLEAEVTECIKQGMSPCDYCIIPEADYILKENTSFLTKVLAQV